MKTLEKNTDKEKITKLNDAINYYTQLMYTEYPELYFFLDESPQMDLQINKEVLKMEELEEYLDSLKTQLAHYKNISSNKARKN